MTQGRLKKSITDYTGTDPLPMHMPGHKRNPGFGCDIFAYDITEIEGFDNLHKPRGIFADAERKTAGIYNARRSYLMVNGATGGILSVIMATARPGGTLAVHSACHISVWHAAELSGCKIITMDPTVKDGIPFYGEITPDTVKQSIIANSDICAVIITSPTYEGIISNTKEIFEVTGKAGIPLIVDAAHGAHLGLSDRFAPAPFCDADIVSMHKTLPAPTQTAAVNLFTDKISPASVEHYIDVFESSSPSYVLMDGAVSCIDRIREDEVPFDEWADALESEIYGPLSSLQNLKLYKAAGHDISKIVILCDGIKLARRLRCDFNIECEAAYPTHLIAMTGAGDTKESLARFKEAILASDLPEYAPGSGSPLLSCPHRETPIPIRDAIAGSKIRLPVEQCVDRISAEYVFGYPPGVPLLIPGELITKTAAERIRQAADSRATLTLSGRRDWDGTLCCLDD